MWSEESAINAEIKGVPPDQRAKAETDMGFVQNAFSKLDARLADLPDTQRLAALAVLAGRMARLLYAVHARVEFMATEVEFERVTGKEGVVELLDAHAERQQVLLQFYHDHR